MKKFLLSFLFMSLIAGLLKAETASIKFSEKGYSNADELTTVAINDDISLIFAKGSNSNGAKYYTSGSAVRMYSSNELTFKAKEGFNISQIVISTAATNSTLTTGYTFTPEGTVTAATQMYTWTGESNSVMLKNGTTTSGHVKIVSIEVTYASAGAVAVYAPQISLEANNTVSITCATEGASIRYTTDGNAPSINSTLYTSPFKISGPTTVKAIAIKGADISAVSTKDLTLNTVSSLAAFIELASSSAVTVDAPLTAVYKNGNYLYVVENNTPLLLYGYNMPEYNNGDVIPAGVTGSYNLRFNNPQMAVEVSTLGTPASGTAVEPEVISIEEISTDMRNRYILIKDVDLTYTSTTVATLKDADDNSVALYNNNFKLDLASGKYDIYGFVNYYNETPQIVPIEAVSLLETVATPVISPASGEVEEGTVVYVTCATDGATIYYTTDGSNPNPDDNGEAIVFPTSGLKLTTATNLSVIAVKEGMNNSEVVSAKYTIKGQQPATSDVTFDFSKPETLNPAQEKPESGVAVNLAGKTLTEGNVAMTFAENSNNSVARLWLTTAGNVELRLYTSDEVSIKSLSNDRIGKIILTFGSGSGQTANPAFPENTGTYDATTATWTCGSAEGVESVSMKVTKSTYLSAITVELIKEDVGIDDIITDDNDQPAEYYNLQGIRMNGDGLTPGLYIKRQGTKTSKVLVR